MLTQDQISNFEEQISKGFEVLEEDLLANFAGKLSKIKDPNFKSTVIATLAYKEARSIVLGTRGKILQKVFDVFDTAFELNNEQDKRIFKGNKLTKTKYYESKLNDILIAERKITLNTLANYTRSLGFEGMPLQRYYQQTLDTAYLAVRNNKDTYFTAFRKAVKKISKLGVEFVDYQGGRRNALDVAVRRAVVQGFSNLSNSIMEQNVRSLKVEMVTISAHSRCRPTHISWQGTTIPFADLEDITGYGRVDGLGGIYCKHVFFPSFGKDQMPEVKKIPDVVYKGKTLDPYEQSQVQRSKERAIRATKRELICFKAGGLDTTGVKQQLKEQTKDYESFSKFIGERSKIERTRI